MIETLEEKMDAFKEAGEYFIARDNILDRLGRMLREFHAKEDGSRLTPRRTPIPVKIAFAGENG